MFNESAATEASPVTVGEHVLLERERDVIMGISESDFGRSLCANDGKTRNSRDGEILFFIKSPPD